MNDRQNLAEHAAGLCVVGLATMGVAAASLVPVAVLAAWGIDHFRTCAARRQRLTIKNVIAEIEKSGADHKSVGPALALLKDNQHKVAISSAVLADADKRGNFPATLYDVVFAGVEVPRDDGVEDMLRLVLTAAWQDLRKDEEYHKIFVQEGVAALERDVADGFARVEALLDDIKDDTGAIREMAEQLVAREEDRARDFGIKEGMLIALARRYAEGNPTDFDAALRGLERALQVAASEAERGQLPGKTDDAVNAVIAQVDALNEDGEIDAAAALIAEEEARAEAGLLRLYDKGIAQAILTRDVKAACAYVLKKLPLETTDTTVQFAALNLVLKEWWDRGRDKGLNFDLEVAVELGSALFALATDAREKGIALNSRAVAMQDLAARSPHLSLEDVIVVKRQVLEYWTRDALPDLWAAGQMNLAVTLDTLGQRKTGTDRLEEAVAAFRAALKQYIRDRVPLDWAMTHMNLGNALQTLGTRETGTLRLEEAVTAYREALEEFPRDRVPLDWAGTQMNLGNALTTLGTRETGTDRLEDAVTAYRAALEEFARDGVPLDWANTRGNEGVAHLFIAERTGDLACARQALDQLTEAEAVLREGGHAAWALTFERKIPEAQALVDRLSGNTA